MASHPTPLLYEQQQAAADIFCGEFSCPLDFLQMLHSYVENFFNWIVTVLPWEQPKLSPRTEFGLPPHTTALPTTTGRAGYIFVVSFHVL